MSNDTETVKLVNDKIVGANKNISLIEVHDPIQALRKEQVRVVLDFEKEYQAKLKDGKPFEIKLMYDKSKAKSEGAYGIVAEAIGSLNRAVIIIALGMTFTGIQIALSTYAKSFKEAQTYMSFLIFASMIPSYATMFMQPDDIQVFMFAAPVLNTISALKMLLGSIINYQNLLLALVTSVIYLGITLWFAASMFNKEKVLFRS